MNRLKWAMDRRVDASSLKLMLMMTAACADETGGGVDRTMQQYMEMTGLAKRTVLKRLRDLVRLRVLEQIGVDGQTKLYRFNAVESIPKLRMRS